MQWIMAIAIAIRAAATARSLILTVRLRNWRWGALSAWLVAMTAQATFEFSLSAGSTLSPASDAMTLVISVLAFIVVHGFAVSSTRQARSDTLTRAFRTSPDAIVVSSFPKGTIFEANQGVERVIGYSPEEAMGRTPQELRLWADSSDREHMMEALQRTGDVRDLDIRLRHKNGEIRRCQVSAEIIEVAGQATLLSILRDVTEQKDAQEALRASEAMFSKVFRASPDAITITSLAGGKFVEINESFTKITGHRRPETLGRTSIELGLWADPAERDRLRQQLKEQGVVSNREVTFHHQTGRSIECLVSAEVVEFAGEPNLLMTVRDVTERAALVRELEAKNAELERFSYTLSHDLKSPLVTVNGFLGLLERDLAAGDLDKAYRDLDRAHRAARTMSRQVDELLELSRIGRVANPFEEVSLSELFFSASELVASQIGERGVSLEIDPEMPTLRGDRSRLLEVFQNLLDNAVKFMGDQQDPRIQVGSRRQESEEIIFVRDNGVGIDPRYHQKVFGLFDRLDPKIEGTGVGLALVKRIIEVHGGRVWVESEGPGQGSALCFTLPREPQTTGS